MGRVTMIGTFQAHHCYVTPLSGSPKQLSLKDANHGHFPEFSHGVNPTFHSRMADGVHF